MRALRVANGWLSTRGLEWVLSGVLLVLLLLIAMESPALVRLMALNSDLSAPVAIADLAHQYENAQIVTGRLGWWEGLWFLQVIRPLPGSTTLGLWLPLLLSGAVTVALAWQARRLWGSAPALVCLLVAVAVSGPVLQHQASWSGRAPTWWAMALVGIVVVASANDLSRGARVRSLLLAIGGLVAAVHAGLTLSGDVLAVPAVLVPLTAGAVTLARARRWPAFTLTVTMGLVALAAAVLSRSFADSRGYLRQEFPVSFIPSNDLLDGLGKTLGGITRLWQGPRGFGDEVGPMAVLGVVAALAGVVITLVVVGVAVARLWRLCGGYSEPERPQPGAAGLSLERSLWMAYWLSATVAILAGFWVSDVSGLDGGVARYLYGVPLAVGALAAGVVRARGPASTAVVGGALAVALVAIAGFLRVPPGRDVPADLQEVARIARAEGVTRGYAPYWPSYALSYASDYELDVTPVGRCDGLPGYRLCPMYLHYIDQAYAPRNQPSFLVVDRTAGFPPTSVTQLPTGLRPAESHQVSPAVTVHIFRQDIASELSGNLNRSDPRRGRGGPVPPR